MVDFIIKPHIIKEKYILFLYHHVMFTSEDHTYMEYDTAWAYGRNDVLAISHE